MPTQVLCPPDLCFRNTDFAISKLQSHVTFNAGKCSKRVQQNLSCESCIVLCLFFDEKIMIDITDIVINGFTTFAIVI